MVNMLRCACRIAAFAIFAGQYSCIDKQYDLSDLDTDDVTIGNELTLPLGTGIIAAGDIVHIGDNKEITVDDAGNYVARYSGEIGVDMPGEIGIGESCFSESLLDIPLAPAGSPYDYPEDAEIELGESSIGLDLATSNIVRLDSVLFDNRNGASRLELKLSVENLRLDDGDAEVAFRASFPKGYRMASETGQDGNFADSEYSCTIPMRELTGRPKSVRLLLQKAVVGTDSRTYLQIYFGGAVFLFLYNTLNGIYNAQGDSKTPLIFLMISSLTNIVLDLLFVIRFGMGVAGVAWATLIAQGLCAVASLLVLLRRMRRMPCEPEKQGVKLPLFHIVAVKRIAQIGLPSMLQQSLVSLSMMMMQGLVNSFGKVLVAGYTAATKIDSLAMLPNMNISNAMSSFTAQNIGAGKYERVKEGLKACLLMVAVFSLLITVIIFLFGNQLLSLFLDPGDASGAMGYGLAYMHTVSLFYILMGLLFVPNGMLRGAGDMAAFTFSSMANLFSRVGIAYALVYLTPLGANAIWWSIPAGWLIGAAVSLLRVKSGKWMRKAVADR